MNSVADIWSSILSILSEELSSTAMSAWFSDCEAVALDGNKFVLRTTTKFKKSIIEPRFGEMISNALKTLFGSDFEVIFLCEDETYAGFEENREIQSETEYTFDNFIVGSSNKFAHAAALAVSKGVTKDYNPLFIYGDSGLGKTHLLYAIQGEIKKTHPEYKIVYVKCEDFANELFSSIQAGKMFEFREKYRNADLFLMDDVQFIAGKESSQEEMFHTFNNLYELGNQIIFTADLPPRDMPKLDDRLKTRFESGLTACIERPDYETRLAIVKNKAAQLGLTLDDEIADYVASVLTSNVRQLEGGVNKIRAEHEMMGTPLTLFNVKEILGPIEPPKITPDVITSEVSKYFSLSVDDIKGLSRTKKFVTARQVAMFLMRTMTDMTLTEVGNYFKRDHTTVMNAISKTEQNIKGSGEFFIMLRELKSNIADMANSK